MLKASLNVLNNSGAAYALIVGDDEVEKNQYGFKALRDDLPPQLSLSEQALVEQLQTEFKFTNSFLKFGLGARI